MSTLWLIGMMGSGKTTVGHLLAADAEVPFVDLDGVIEDAAGMTVTEIFDTEGEAGFRELEQQAVASTAGAGAVVACGGGVVLRAENRCRMRDSGLVVWLHAPVAELALRVGGGNGRPLLAGADIAATLGGIAADREAAYQAASHHRIETGGKTPEQVGEEVSRLWSDSK